MHTTRRRFVPFVLSAGLTLLSLGHPAAGLAATSGAGPGASESRSVGEFQAVALEGSMDLVVRQGATTSVTVQADDRLRPLLETVVETGSHGATLHVRWKPGTRLHDTNRVLVSVTTPRLTALAASGSGDIRVESFNTPALDLSLSGSSDAKLDRLTTSEFGIHVAGSGDVAAAGRAEHLKVSIAGSGNVSLEELLADDVSVRIAGSGDAVVNAQKTLDVSIAGSGDVSYRGNPSLKSSVAGSGSVSKR